MKLLVGLLAVAVVLFMYTQLGESDDESKPRVCPSCGVQALYSSYQGHNKPVKWSCTRCGHVKT